MFRVGRRVGAVSGFVVLALAAGSSSGVAAATPVRTMIVMSPIRDIAYGDTTVTIHGTLETYAPAAADARPIAGRPVGLLSRGTWTHTDLGTVTTAGDGTFSLTATLPTPGVVEAAYAGDADYAGTSHGVRVTPVRLPARVTLDPLPKTVTAYSGIPVTGTVEMQTADGRWIPAPDTAVKIDDKGVRQTALARTDAAGGFRGAVNPTSPGPWTAATVGDSGTFAGVARSAGQTIDVTPAPVQISGFTARAYPGIPVTSVAAFQGIGFSATVTPYVGGQQVDLYFQPRGSTTWSLFGSYPVPPFGAVTISGISGYATKGRPREGSWQLRTAAMPLLQAATTPALPVEVYLRTSFRGLKIKKVHGKAYYQGALYSENGPLAGQQVVLEYRYPTGTADHYVTTVTTGKGGAFSVRLPAARRYYRVLTGRLTGDYEGLYGREIYFSG